MKVLIVGSKGMAGHILYTYFKENTDFQLIDIARGDDGRKPTHQLDVTNFDAFEKVLKLESPDVVVNCIGILNQDAETNPDKAVLINSYLPHFLAKKGTELGYKFIHISTDCVFDGKKGGYTETSEKTGKGFYATTKALGEVDYGNHVTLRTSIIGPELKKNGIGLFHWFMNQEGSIKGFTKAFWSGVTTIVLARAVQKAIEEKLIGLHHVTNEQKIDKFALTNLFKEVFGKNKVSITPYDGYAVDKSLVRANHDFTFTVPTYEEMIVDMKNWMALHKSFYPHYFE